MPALAAPQDPTATVATGTPLGICTIDSNESRPLSEVDGIGTPMTGSGDNAATTPGSAAAPAAAAGRDEHAQAAGGGAGRPLLGAARGAMGGGHHHLAADAEGVEHGDGLQHGVEVRVAAEHDAHLDGSRHV